MRRIAAEQIGQHGAAVEADEQGLDVLTLFQLLFHLQAQHDGSLLEGLRLGKLLLAQGHGQIEFAAVFQAFDLIRPGL